MTISEVFFGVTPKKLVWAKRGGTVSKKTEPTAAPRPRSRIQAKGDTNG